MRIALYGAGGDCLNFLKEQAEHPKIYRDEILHVFDTNSARYPYGVQGYTVYGGQQLVSTDFDFVVITSRTYEREIRSRLIDASVPQQKILSLDVYRKKCIVAYQSNLKEPVQEDVDFQPFSTDSLVIYTAIIGHYDTLKPPLVRPQGVRFICYTDQDNLEGMGWEIRRVAHSDMSAPLIVRQYKLLPHRFFQDVQTSIWVDASMTISGDLTSYIKRYQKQADFLVMPHPERYCIFDEAAVCMQLHKEKKSKILRQITAYYVAGMPLDYGLYIGGILVRNHNVPTVRQTMELWFHEVEEYSFRDQLSLPYVLYKTGLPIDVAPVDYLDNPWIKIEAHL